MRIELITKNSTKFNKITQNCLKHTDTLDYIDITDEDMQADKKFEIYDSNDLEIATIDACLASDKAGIQLIRMRTKECLDMQENILNLFLEYIFDYKKMNQYVLECHLFIEGSGIDYSTVEHIGFIGRTGPGSILYTYLNPKYLEIVDTFSIDDVTKEKLVERYNKVQKRKIKMINKYKEELNGYYIMQNFSLNNTEIRVKWLEETINNLENTNEFDESNNMQL